ncbi:MAG: flagellin, partial [Longimicrobiales bacterium]
AQAAVPASTHTAEALLLASGTASGSSVTANGTYTGTGDTVSIRRNAGAWEISEDGGAWSAITTGATVGGVTYTITDGTTTDAVYTLDVTAAQAAVAASGGARSFLVSSSGDYAGADAVTISSLDLQLATLGLGADTLGTKAGAQTALVNLDAAITTISGVFGDIGAAQNRIDYATANVKTSIENFAAAESVIRDADMAAEMAEFTKNQILQQAGVAMLAQANAAPQLVLRLLQ